MKIIISLIFIIIGYLMRYFSIMKLQKNFTIRLIPPKEFITDGIFKYVRHPCYGGTILMFFGLTWLSSNIWMALIISTFMGSFFFERVDREEEMMYRIFKEDYLDYAKRTKIFFPFIL